MGLAEIQAIKKLSSEQVYKGEEPTERIKASLKPKEPYQIPKQSAKAKAKVVEDKALSKLDDIFYEEVWQASPHVCQCGCKAKLTSPWKRIYFHHLLEKDPYPAFRHTHENIMILAMDCHKAINDGGLEKRPEVKRRTAEAIKLLLK